MDADPIDLEELYRRCNRGLRYWFAKQVSPQDVDDCVHDAWLDMARAASRLKRPECAMGYLMTIARRQVFKRIEHYRMQRTIEPLEFTSVVDGCDDPEHRAIEKQELTLAAAVLRTMKPLDQELIVRGFLRDEPAEVTKRALGISETTYRIEKSRAKKRFAARVQKRLHARAFKVAA